jgi:hypothetical protein
MKLFTKSFLLVVALLLIGEASVRIFWSRSMSGRFEYGYNMTAGFEEESGKVNLVRAGGRRFHPQSFDMPKPDGVFRVFVIGDSVPRGPSLKKAYAYQLEQILKEKGIQAEILNLGVPGYGARRTQIVLKQIIKYQPDLIIKHVNWTNEYEDEREYRRAQEFKSWHPKNWLMKSMLLARLNESQTENIFWKLLPPEIRMQRGINDADAEIAASQNDEKRREWRRFVVEKSLEDARILKGAGVPGLFIIQAKVHKTAKGDYSLSDDGMDSLQTLLSKEGMNTLSMKEVFSHDSDLKIIFSDGSHLYPVGHRRMAEVLAIKLNPLISK